MIRRAAISMLAISSSIALSPALAQTPASGDVLPDAVAVSCIRVVPTVDEMFLFNDCTYRVTVAACIPRNARASLLCKTEAEDISTKTFRISARGNATTGFPNGASIYQMACKDPAKPVLVSGTSGKCVQP